LAWQRSSKKLSREAREDCGENQTSGVEGLSEVDKKYLERTQILLSMQKDFFERVGVSEYVTRLGQEPFHYKAAWTISIPDMERFGIRNVEGPTLYGSPKYCSEWVLSNKPRLPVKCLNLTPEMLELMK
jgi:hypothetical protein